MQNQKNLEDILKDLNFYLSEEEKKWIKDYLEAGEEGLAFDLLVDCILNKKIPLAKEIYDWIQWYGSGSEKMGVELFSDWKKISKLKGSGTFF